MSGGWKSAVRAVAGVAVLVAVVCGATFYLQPLWVNDQMIRYRMARQHVESRYIQVDGYKLHYFEARPVVRGGPERPLVLVHGLGSRGEDWSPMIPTLAAAGFHVYVPDLLGFGRSPRPDVDYSMGLQEKTVLDFMQTLNISHADVGGWSMGGWVALKLTLDHPEKVDRVVVYDSVGIYFPPTFEASLFTPTDAAGLFELSQRLTPNAKPFPGFVSRAAIRKLGRTGWVIDRSMASMEQGRDLLDFRLREMERPTLIVWGGLDELIPLAVGEAMHRAIPGSAMVVVDGCGHLAPGECAKPVLAKTIEFLKAEPAIRGGESRVDGTAK